jgi:hypothetical protein
MVDLHSHTDRSDGTLPPEELVDFARRQGLSSLAITDHDTVEGYDAAAPHARETGLDLVCGVELSAKFHDRTIHILGYFLEQPPGEAFRGHLSCLQTARRERNERLVERLRQLGLSVRLEDAQRLGRSQTGRPHFAQLLVQKGYAPDIRAAFDQYLDEAAPGFVERQDPSLENVLRWIHEAGGISSWAHPGRFLRQAKLDVEALFSELAAKGMNAIEAFHTDHLPEEAARFEQTARKLSLGVSGGSDFHGARGRAQLASLQLPGSLLEDLRALSRRVAARGDL